MYYSGGQLHSDGAAVPRRNRRNSGGRRRAGRQSGGPATAGAGAAPSSMSPSPGFYSEGDGGRVGFLPDSSMGPEVDEGSFLSTGGGSGFGEMPFMSGSMAKVLPAHIANKTWDIDPDKLQAAFAAADSAAEEVSARAGRDAVLSITRKQPH